MYDSAVEKGEYQQIDKVDTQREIGDNKQGDPNLSIQVQYDQKYFQPAPEQISHSQKLDEQELQQAQYQSSLAIMEIPTAFQIDESQILSIKERQEGNAVMIHRYQASPYKTLHNIITHNVVSEEMDEKEHLAKVSK